MEVAGRQRLSRPISGIKRSNDLGDLNLRLSVILDRRPSSGTSTQTESLPSPVGHAVSDQSIALACSDTEKKQWLWRQR